MKGVANFLGAVVVWGFFLWKGWRELLVLCVFLTYCALTIWLWRTAKHTKNDWWKLANIANIGAIGFAVLFGALSKGPLCADDDHDCDAALHQLPR